jgi:DNA replication ATP-dependent helicase Dna2
MDGLEDIVVDTVERIQGQERDIIIVSLTTSDPAHAVQRAEFYFQPNRLNVAITRPRVKRIVIGSPLLFAARPPDKRLSSWVDHFRALYEQSYIVRLV